MMRDSLLITLLVILAAQSAPFVEDSQSREFNRPEVAPFLDLYGPPDYANRILRELHAPVAMDTFYIVAYTFDQMNWQGWTRIDKTAQYDDFFHVDDFAGLGGGSHGRLVPIAGEKSVWCGVRPNPNDEYLCHWKNAPGYGNNWNQFLMTENPIAAVGMLRFSYRGAFDSENAHDYTQVEYDAGGDRWEVLETYTGVHDAVNALHILPMRQARTKLRFHFISDNGFSDEDGLWDSDGAAIIDDIRLQDDAGLNIFENFEAANVGAGGAGIWRGFSRGSFGRYSGLKWEFLNDKDPCHQNLTTHIAFFLGSADPSVSYPGLFNTPACADFWGSDLCQHEIVVSPIIDMTMYSTNKNHIQNANIPAEDITSLGGCYLRFTVYRHSASSLYYVWHVRTIDESGCPGQWRDRQYAYYGYEPEYAFITQDISDLITNSPIQIAVGVIDLCSSFYPFCSYNPTPWIDNVKLLRFKSLGPQWWYSDHTLFQDNFPPTGNLEGKVRADVAIDNYHSGNEQYSAGDSAVVSCSSPLGAGIAIDNTGAHIGDPAVYMHVKATYVATDGNPLNKPMQLFGPKMAGDCGWYDSDDGALWTILQCDRARIIGHGIAKDRYMVDLNDSLFTRGYRIEYYFTAIDNLTNSTALPQWARSRGPYFEWTCLPTLSSKVLFVNAYDGICASEGPADAIWKSTFKAVLPSNNQPDIFHVNSPGSQLWNGLASRAKPEHLKPYLTIIWESGDLYDGIIYDGGKCDDDKLLSFWGNFSAFDLGLWFCGDNIARRIDRGYFTMLSIWFGLEHVNVYSYYNVTGGSIGGGTISPLLTGNPESGIFVHNGIPDELFLEGGCPLINSFDILEKSGDAKYALDYPSYMGTDYNAALSNHLSHTDAHVTKAVLFGFSLISVRDAMLFPGCPTMRFRLAADVFNWMSVPIKSDITQAEPPFAYSLEQNYPNPFNPVTTIHFAMKEKGAMTLKVYNVAGQLIKTLVDGVMEASAHTIIWDGCNNAGQEVASGIYFYKMAAGDFSETRKLVLLR